MMPEQAAGSGDLVQATRASMLVGFASRLKDNAAQTFKEAKPWGEVFDRNSFAKPANMIEATGRIRKNVGYFRMNYLIAAGSTTALVMVMNPVSLIVLAFLAAVWGYVYMVKSGPLVLGGRELSERERFLALSAGSLVVIFFLTSVGSVIFYALGLSFLLICLHGAVRVPDDLFIDETPEAGTGGGFLSLLTGGGKAAPAVAAGV